MSSVRETFRCYMVRRKPDGTLQASVEMAPTSELPEGDVLVRVAYSSLNYKDALSATGHPGITRQFPHVPGIDAAGTVINSRSPQWQAGDEVIITGFEQGVSRWGGFAELVRVPAEWILRLPTGLSLRESMIYGTAGFTAGQCVAALRDHHVMPQWGEIVVTGASGGVGSVATALLARLGYTVVAVSGKPDAERYLRALGASRVVGRDEVDDRSEKPLLASRWAGAVDTVGGNTLATLLRSTKQDGCVAACGLVGGAELSLTVYPFILRGASLIGIDSALCPMEQRLPIWSHLATDWKPEALESIATEIGLGELDPYVKQILAGRTMGRIVVRPDG